MKRFIISFAVLLSVFACSLPDEPEGEEYFGHLTQCSASGIYEAIITANSVRDEIGLWCEITGQPDVIDEGSTAPGIGSWVYFNRFVLNRAWVEVGDTILFRIIDFGDFPKSFPYSYTFYQNHTYCIANIELIYIDQS
jgi:hypothetical protein